MKYKCKCGWVYDPAKTGKEFSEEPADYKCPECGAGKSAFTKMETNENTKSPWETSKGVWLEGLRSKK